MMFPTQPVTAANTPLTRKRTRDLLRRLRRDDSGDGALGSVISMSMFIMLLVLFVWMVLTYYSYRILSSAANEGASVAARYDVESKGNPNVSLERGEDYAAELINDAGASALVEGISTSSGFETENGVERAVISVSGQAVTPLFQMTLEATGSAPIEEFRNQGDNTPGATP